MDERFAAELHAANTHDRDGRAWTYLPYGPFASEGDYRRWLASSCLESDPLFHAIVDNTSVRAVGVAAYMRIAPAKGSKSVTSIFLHCSSARPRRLKPCT